MFAAAVEHLCGAEGADILEAAAAGGDPAALFIAASLDPALADQRLSLSAAKGFSLAKTALATQALASDHEDAESISTLRRMAASTVLTDDVATAQALLAASALQGGKIEAAVPLLLACGVWILDPCAPPRHIQAARKALRNLAALCLRGPSFSKHVIPDGPDGAGQKSRVRDAVAAFCLLSVLPHSSQPDCSHVQGSASVGELIDKLRSACPLWPSPGTFSAESSGVGFIPDADLTPSDLTACQRLIHHLRNKTAHINSSHGCAFPSWRWGRGFSVRCVCVVVCNAGQLTTLSHDIDHTRAALLVSRICPRLFPPCSASLGSQGSV
jgi:hypothetical protein